MPVRAALVRVGVLSSALALAMVGALPGPAIAGDPSLVLHGGQWVAYRPLLRGGHWVAYRPLGTVRAQSGSPLVKAVRRACPAGTTNYSGKAQPYSCLAVYQDNANKGHEVGLRQGHADPDGFGLLHALRDHNVDEDVIAEVIVNNVAGIHQSGNRFVYGLKYVVDQRTIVSVEVR